MREKAIIAIIHYETFNIVSHYLSSYICPNKPRRIMIDITLPDGSVKSFEENATPMDIAQSISEGLARNVISASFNNSIIETSTPLTMDGSLILYTWNNKEGKTAFWHSSAHAIPMGPSGQEVGRMLKTLFYVAL